MIEKLAITTNRDQDPSCNNKELFYKGSFILNFKVWFGYLDFYTECFID